MNEKEIIEKYNYLDDDNVIFMNDGYCPLDEDGYPAKMDIELTEKYRPWRYQVYMYKLLMDFIKMDSEKSKEKTILDVGCGRGGGLSFYKDYYQFKSLHGVDLNPEHKRVAQTHTDIEVHTSSAISLPFDSKSFDIITCVESSPYYHPFESYVSEIKRILKPGGIYVRAERYVQTPDYFLNDDFIQVKYTDINHNARVSCSISKWTTLQSSEKMSRVLFADEEEYIENRTTYNVTSYIKKTLD
jgi:ubiquinone/menaquinone biosynthesis C-methylase UbiE